MNMNMSISDMGGNATNSSSAMAIDWRLAYCGQDLVDFSDSYKEIHKYTSLLVCLFGSIANTLNIAVLSRHEMSSPTNSILMGLAVADLLVMLEYIPYACYNFLPYQDRMTYGWAVFVLFHSNFTQVGHTISIWLTVTLAIWRYIAVAHAARNREWCSTRTTIIAISSAYLVCPFLCLPLFLSFNISAFVMKDDNGTDSGETSRSNPMSQNETSYRVGLSQLAETPLAGEVSLVDINFWVYSVVIKLIPCVALTVLSLRLVFALIETKKRRQHLTNATPMTSSSSKGGAATNGSENKKMLKKKSSRLADKERQTDRTTRMLLAVLLLFLITEFPQGILGLLSGILGKAFFMSCYAGLGEVMDILALINSAINFILYCTMSRQFRTTFGKLFKPKILNRWMLVPQQNGDTTANTTQVTQV